MKVFRFLLFSFLILVPSTLTVFAQTAEYQYTFTFSDEFNNSQDLILGKDPFGTDGIDTLFGEEFVPQVPPGEFGIRFQLPIDTSITTIKDIRFGCYWATGFVHLVDLNYQSNSSSISVVWDWGPFDVYGLNYVDFYNPYTGQMLAWYEWQQDPSIFNIPQSLDKIEIWASYGGTLSTVEYELYTPNGGEIIQGGNIYDITWWSNQLAPWLDIEFSSDSGNSWELIAESVWTTNTNYSWNVPNINSDGCIVRIGSYPCAYDQSDSFFTITTPVSIDIEKSTLTKFSLEQNFPNPFNPTTKIEYQIPRLSFITLKVYNVLGNEIATLVNEEKAGGSYEVEFNGSELSGGIYFYKLQAGGFVETKKMILLK